MDIINILIISSVLIASFLGTAVFFHRQRGSKWLSASFALISVAIVFWSVFIIFYRISEDVSEAILLTRLHHMASLFIPVFFFNFSFLYIRPLINLKRFFILIPYISALILSYFVFFTQRIIIDVQIPEIGEKIVSFAPGYLLYSAHFTIFFSAGLLLLLFSYFKSQEGGYRRRTLILFIGVLLASAVGLTTNLTLPWFGIFTYNWFGNIATTIYVAFMFYAIAQFKLFDLKVIATEIFTYFIISFLFVQLFLADSTAEVVITAGLLILVAILSYLLLKSVYREVETRREVERLAKNLEKANKRLQEMDKLKSQFLSIASHDLRAPLTAIRNFMSILLEGTYGKLPEAAEEGTRQVYERATEMADMVDNYLNVSRIEQGRMKYDFADMNLADTINEAVDAFGPVAKEKGLELKYTEITESLSVKGDEPKLREVIENLINNAINYTQKGSITVSVEKLANKVKIVFEDTGIGMSQKTINNLFGLFSPGEDSRKYNPKSTGVGLYITKAHVEAHKGTIRAESEGEGNGSRFVVELPLI